MALNALFEGQVITKLFVPIQNAVVKVFVDNVSNPFTGVTDERGYFSVKLPAASTLEIVKAKVTVIIIFKSY